MTAFSGSFTALITPFSGEDAGTVDAESFQELVDWQISEGSHGLVPCGTTGESPTLSHAEHRQVIELCVEAAAGRVPVMAGTGSNSTAEAVELTRHAERAGADAVLVVTPYYNKPTQEGLYRHFEAIHDVTGLPIFIYNIPGRSIVDMSVETMARLAALPNIAGVKDASNDLARPTQTRLAINGDFAQFSGEDGTAAAFLAQGGHGCISVTANVAPGLCARMQDAWRSRDLDVFNETRDRLMPLHDALFVETSPTPVKYAAARLGLSRETVRLPLAPLSEAGRRSVDKALAGLGLV